MTNCHRVSYPVIFCDGQKVRNHWSNSNVPVRHIQGWTKEPSLCRELNLQKEANRGGTRGLQTRGLYWNWSFSLPYDSMCYTEPPPAYFRVNWKTRTRLESPPQQGQAPWHRSAANGLLHLSPSQGEAGNSWRRGSAYRITTGKQPWTEWSLFTPCNQRDLGQIT